MNRVKKWFKHQIRIIKDEFTYEPPQRIVKNYLRIILGACLVAFGDAFFLIRCNVIAGGVGSISMLIHKIPGFDILEIDTYVLIVTWFFFFLGLILLGMKYAIHTLAYTITYPLMVMLFTFMIEHVVVQGVPILDIRNGYPELIEGMVDMPYLVSAVVGGFVVGTGIGLTLSGGGSSGGTDVINLLAHKYLRVKVGTSSFCVDTTLIVLGFIANGNSLLPTLVGLVASMLCSIMIDKVFMGNNQYYLALVITDKWEELNDFINHELGRGTTLLKAQGGYTKKDSVVLQICFDRQDYNIIKDTIDMIDPNAFFTVMQTKEVLGYGFSRLTPKTHRKGVSLDAEEAQKLYVKARSKNKKTFK